MFAFRDHAGEVEVAFTDATLDLHQDAPGFAEAWQAVVEATGVPFARANQVHGAEVATVVDEPTGGPGGDVPRVDALVTARSGVGLMVRVADCVPVVLADPAVGVLGAAHAGRLGMSLDVVGRTVEQMRALGAREVRAWIGPHVCGRCYEVPESLRREIAAAVPASWSETSWGTPALDLGAGVASQLAVTGVPAVHVGRCTLEDAQLHSFRRDGARAGRFAGLVWLP